MITRGTIKAKNDLDFPILIFCTCNSCRSQVAEAMVNECLGETWEAFSPGTKPTGSVHRMALAEIGYKHQDRLKLGQEFCGGEFNPLLTLCDSTAEKCPIRLRKEKRVHYRFAEWTRMDDINVFRKLCDKMGR